MADGDEYRDWDTDGGSGGGRHGPHRSGGSGRQDSGCLLTLGVPAVLAAALLAALRIRSRS